MGMLFQPGSGTKFPEGADCLGLGWKHMNKPQSLIEWSGVRKVQVS